MQYFIIKIIYFRQVYWRQRMINRLKTSGYSISNWIIKAISYGLLPIRIILIAILIAYDLFFQQYIQPLIIIHSYFRRYLGSLVNLLCLRIVLLLLGFSKVYSNNYNYFSRSNKLYIRSGSISIAPYSGIIDFLYYSHIFNPTFVRMIQYHPDVQNKQNCNSNKPRLLFMPLTFRQALLASFSYRGFDPIVFKGNQIRKFKCRKVQLTNLINESQQNLSGPILIFLPQLVPQQLLNVHPQLGKLLEMQQYNKQIYGFSSSMFTSNNNAIKQKRRVYLNQLQYLFSLCCNLKKYTLRVQTVDIKYIKYNADENAFTENIHSVFGKIGYGRGNKTFQQYIMSQIKDKQEKKNKKKKGNHEKHQKRQQKTNNNNQRMRNTMDWY